MKIFISGGTGFIGSALAADLLARGHHVVATGTASRHRTVQHDNFRYVPADTTREGAWQSELEDVDGVVNLAGRTIMKRWTERYKKQIYESRIATTRNIVDALAVRKGTFLCSASAVGYYGDRGDALLTENEPPGQGFLARVGKDWEEEALRADEHGVRVTLMRFGIVLGRGGGAMEKMIPVFRMYLGGPLGDGRQWFPWIHMRDLLSAVRYLMETDQAKGAFNFSAPHPVRNLEFAKTLARLLRVPAVMPAPQFMVRMAMGEMASAFFDSLRAVPQKLLDRGFRFNYPELEDAVQQIVQ